MLRWAAAAKLCLLSHVCSCVGPLMCTASGVQGLVLQAFSSHACGHYCWLPASALVACCTCAPGWLFRLAIGAQLSLHSISCIICWLQIASYAGLDIVAKVVFGWIIMLLGYPMIGKQMNMEHEQ